MTTRPSTTEPDRRADAYRAALDGPPRPDHVDELKRLGLPIPRTQREASDLVSAFYRGRAVQR